MGGLHIFLVLLSGVLSCRHDLVSGSLLKVRVRSGDNITLYCDCKVSSGEHTVWYRNCSHENQPSLILKVKELFTGTAKIPPRFQFVKNFTSGSYNLLITNITDSDEGLYYCGTEQIRVEDKEYIAHKCVYRYGNVTTKIIFDSCEPQRETPLRQDCGVCWTLLFSLCPTFAVLSILLSCFLVYCQKKAKEPEADQQRPQTRQTRLNQDEDVCYATVEIRQASQRPKKKKSQSSDFCTYSAINTSRM